MQKAGFTSIIIIIALLIGSYYLINKFFAKTPNPNTIKLASLVNKYHNSADWKIQNNGRICIYYLDQCTEVSSRIIFKSSDKWSDIYNFYKENFTKEGWRTESSILTSIPTSIVLENDQLYKNSNCSVVIKEKKDNLLGLLENKNKMTFQIDITCSPV